MVDRGLPAVSQQLIPIWVGKPTQMPKPPERISARFGGTTCNMLVCQHCSKRIVRPVTRFGLRWNREGFQTPQRGDVFCDSPACSEEFEAGGDDGVNNIFYNLNPHILSRPEFAKAKIAKRVLIEVFKRILGLDDKDSAVTKEYINALFNALPLTRQLSRDTNGDGSKDRLVDLRMDQGVPR